MNVLPFTGTLITKYQRANQITGANSSLAEQFARFCFSGRCDCSRQLCPAAVAQFRR